MGGPNDPHPALRPRIWLLGLTWLLPYLVLTAAFAWEFQAVRQACGGRFIYSLDDPYIHLALAEEIAAGTYGINPGEPASPSSSVLWPFLLAPFARLEGFDLVPLVLNFLVSLATLYVYTQFAQLTLGYPGPPAAVGAGGFLGGPPAVLSPLATRAWAAWIATLLIPATNLVGLAFTGMEHTLQSFLCAATMLGLIRALTRKRSPGWLAPVMILACLTRYECLAVVLPAALVLWLRRERKTALLGLLGSLFGLAVFSCFLHAQGLAWFPASVLSKSGFSGPGGLTPDLVDAVENQIHKNMSLPLAKLLAWGGLALFLTALVRPTHRLFAAAAAVSISLHLAFGQFGWWDRYEIYSMVTAGLALLWVSGEWLARLCARAPILLAAGFLLVLALPAAVPYTRSFQNTPLASANIYEQQYQMHRFVVDYYKAPVAVNDLGWVAYRSPYYTLDLWGLASLEALEARARSLDGSNPSPQWMDRLARQKGVHLALIYNTWFPVRPPNWTLVARLYLAGARTSAGDAVVSFYLLEPTRALPLKAILTDFETTLPRGVRLEMIQ